jgi:branched-chain amino acid transport system substrate-binding protein
MSPACGRVATAAAVLAAVVALAACGSDGDSGGSSGGRKVLDLKIGDLVSKTGGPLEQFGEPAQQAADLAVDEIRKAAAKAGARHKITITHADDKSLPKVASDHAKTMVENGTSCLVGPWAANIVSRVASQISIPKKVLQILPATSGDAFTKADDKGYLNRTVPPDRLQADALVELLDDELRGARGKTVNVGALESTYGKDLLARFDDTWTGRGGKVENKVTYSADQQAFTEETKQLGSGRPDAWVFFDFIETYTRFANDLIADKSSRFSPKRTFGTDSLANPRLGNTAPAASEGLRGVAISAPKEGKTAKEFDKRYKARGRARRQTFDAQQFDAVVLCYLSAVAAGSTKGTDMADKVQAVSAPPGRKFTWMQLDQAVKALEAGQDIDYDGASGPIDMNDAGDATAGVYDVYEFRSAKIRVGKQIAVPERAGGI